MSKASTSISRTLLLVCAVGLALYVAEGCAGEQKNKTPTTQPMTAAERSDKALRDPFGYSPDFGDTDSSRGGDAALDRKGLQRDLGHVIMP